MVAGCLFAIVYRTGRTTIGDSVDSADMTLIPLFRSVNSKSATFIITVSRFEVTTRVVIGVASCLAG